MSEPTAEADEKDVNIPIDKARRPDRPAKMSCLSGLMLTIENIWCSVHADVFAARRGSLCLPEQL
jgi:hypothetical protein